MVANNSIQQHTKEEPCLRNCNDGHKSAQELKQAIDEVGDQKHERQSPGLDADPPRQRQTRWLVGSASVTKGSFYSANAGKKNTATCQSSGWSPASF